MIEMKKTRAAICSLAVCILLCSCGEQPEDIVLVGATGTELSGPEREAFSAGADGGQETVEQAAGGIRPEKDGAPGADDAEDSRIYVYVCGAVNNPGVVALPEGSRAEEALKEAGGFREDARTDYVNLAARVTDGEKLYFPTLEETVGAGGTETDAGDGLVNINTADEALLCTLPGIGESRARDIVSFREENGPFGDCEDIMKVPGIKASVYGKIRDKIKIE